jgi:hypothetical protein
MTATVDNAVADLQRTIEELRRQLDEFQHATGDGGRGVS